MIKKIIISLGSLLIILLVAAGWYFSGLIYEGGLNPEFPDTNEIGTAEDRILVSSIDENTITLNVEEELWGVMLERGVYGVRGQNGDAVIGKIITSENNIVKRELINLSGTLVSGDRVSGTNLVSLDENGSYRIMGTSSWSGQASEGVYTPESVSNLAYETISYTSDLGEFPAYLTTEGEKGIVIFIHGFRGNYSREVFALMRSGDLHELGYRSMIISYRNDPALHKDPTGIFQYGTTEWKDINGAINEALKYTDNVILWGTSGGGGPASSWLENVGDSNKVKGIIYEAPVISFWESVEVNGAARFPWVPTQLFSYFKIVTELRYGVDFSAMDFREAVIESDIPVLLFHGDDDEWVPVAMSDYIAYMRAENLTYVRYENVCHFTSRNAYPIRYVKELSIFLNSLD